MKNKTKRNQFDRIPTEVKMQIVSDMQGISRHDAFDAKAVSGDELDIEELSFVTAARKPDFKSFLEKTKQS